MISILFLGFLTGLQHVLEADHLAAVASLATRSRGLAQAARQGVAWGLGHTLTLLVFGGAMLLMDQLVPEQLAAVLEMAAGIMLVVLGTGVLRKLWRERVHLHAHQHGPVAHCHAHSHLPGIPHTADPHRHGHPARLPARALLVGMVHGLAGSAALILLALQTVHDAWLGLLYILIFGAGSIAGMALLTAAISLPLGWSAHSLTWAHNGLKASVGLLTFGIGLHITLSRAAELA
jgi:hypothetical protein